MGWRNLSFRGFADYMQTAEFKKGQSELLDLATEKKWRSCALKLCLGAVIARSISDSPSDPRNRGAAYISATSVRPRGLTPFAALKGGRITYPKIIDE